MLSGRWLRDPSPDYMKEVSLARPVAKDLNQSKAWQATANTSTMKYGRPRHRMVPTHIGLGVFFKEPSHMQMMLRNLWWLAGLVLL